MGKNNYLFIGIMSLVIGIAILAALIGPVRQSYRQRNDTLIERSLPNVAEEVSSYYNAHETLPGSLSDVDATGDTKQLIDSGLVQYKPGATEKEIPVGTSKIINSVLGDTTYKSTAKYQLCVTYVAADDKESYSSSYYDGSGGTYSTYVSTYGHPSGDVCYKLQTSDY